MPLSLLLRFLDDLCICFLFWFNITVPFKRDSRTLNTSDVGNLAAPMEPPCLNVDMESILISIFFYLRVYLSISFINHVGWRKSVLGNTNRMSIIHSETWIFKRTSSCNYWGRDKTTSTNHETEVTFPC